MSILSKIGQAVAGIGIFLSVFFHGPAAAPQQVVGSAIPQQPAFILDSLAQGIGKTDTTMTLVSGLDSQSRALSGYYGFVIDEGTAAQEVVTCTANGTALSACTRGIDVQTGTSSVAANEMVHRRGATVKVTNYPFDGVVANILQGKDGFPSLLHYDTSGFCSGTSPANSICDKNYIDNVAVSGAPNATALVKGIVQLSTAAQAALSSLLGSTGASLILPASIASSTPYSSGLNVVPVTNTSQKLAQSFWDLTQPFTFTGNMTILGTTTMATSTVASSTISNTLNVNNLNILGTVTGTLNNFQDFTGSGTWTKPAGVSANSMVVIEAWGGGGGGGGSGVSSSQVRNGGGGGGGGYSYVVMRASDLTSTVTVTIGAAGAAGLANQSASTFAGTGGDTTFGSYLTAYGGAGGQNGNSSGSPAGGVGGGGGGILGDGSNSTGGAPVGSSAGTDNGGFGGAGGGAASGTAGNNAVYGGGSGGGGNSGNSSAFAGGKSIYGGGGGGTGPAGAGGISILGGAGGAGGAGTTGASGGNGVQPGGGGGAGGGVGSGTGGAGGAGALGEVRIWVIK